MRVVPLFGLTCVVWRLRMILRRLGLFGLVLIGRVGVRLRICAWLIFLTLRLLLLLLFRVLRRGGWVRTVVRGVLCCRLILLILLRWVRLVRL